MTLKTDEKLQKTGKKATESVYNSSEKSEKNATVQHGQKYMC